MADKKKMPIGLSYSTEASDEPNSETEPGGAIVRRTAANLSLEFDQIIDIIRENEVLKIDKKNLEAKIKELESRVEGLETKHQATERTRNTAVATIRSQANSLAGQLNVLHYSRIGLQRQAESARMKQEKAEALTMTLKARINTFCTDMATCKRGGPQIMGKRRAWLPIFRALAPKATKGNTNTSIVRRNQPGQNSRSGLSSSTSDPPDWGRRGPAYWRLHQAEFDFNCHHIPTLCLNLYASFTIPSIGNDTILHAAQLWTEVRESRKSSVPLDAICKVIKTAVSNFQSRKYPQPEYDLVSLQIWQLARLLELNFDHLERQHGALAKQRKSVEAMMADKLPFCRRLVDFIDQPELWDFGNFHDLPRRCRIWNFVTSSRDYRISKKGYVIAVKGLGGGWITVFTYRDTCTIQAVHISDVKLVVTRAEGGGGYRDTDEEYIVSFKDGHGRARNNISVRAADIPWWGF